MQHSLPLTWSYTIGKINDFLKPVSKEAKILLLITKEHTAQ